jgi:signal transduction histidine kinase
VRVPAPRPWDLASALACAIALTADGVNRGTGSLAGNLALSLVACAPLAWRSRAPITALLGTATGLVVCLAAFEPYDTAIFVLMLALYSVAALGDRRRSLLVGAGAAVFLVGLIVIISDDPDTFNEILPRLLLALGALVVGDTVRSRQELRAAEREREERRARESAQESQRRLADERVRIARDLHDTIAHALVAINVRAGVAAHLGPGQDSSAALDDIMGVSTEALDDLRATLSLLRDSGERAPTEPVLDLTAVKDLLENAAAAGLETEADVRLDGHAIPSPVEQAGFRIVQEALTNVMRHANASRATVAFNVDQQDVLHIHVVDDGDGASPDGGLNAGHGLQGMTERATALGGDVVAGPDESGGWRVHARLPLNTPGWR